MREDKVRVSKINSIMFQISMANIAILIAFIIVMAFVMMSMKTTTTSSQEMFGTMMSLTQDEAQLKNDVMSLYDQTTGYVAASAQETRTALLPQIEAVKSAIQSDISVLKSDFAAMGNQAAQDQGPEATGLPQQEAQPPDGEDNGLTDDHVGTGDGAVTLGHILNEKPDDQRQQNTRRQRREETARSVPWWLRKEVLPRDEDGQAQAHQGDQEGPGFP